MLTVVHDVDESNDNTSCSAATIGPMDRTCSIAHGAKTCRRGSR
jgi:hypothetical protein